MVVIGDRLSSNTGKLLSVCAESCPSFLVEGCEELRQNKKVLSRFHTIGCTAGASTPARTIKEVLSTMSELTNEEILAPEEPQSAEFPAEETAAPEAAEETAPATEEDEFSAALEASLQGMSTDQKVKGIVTAINPSEIQVDIGRKQTGYVAANEYSNDPNADLTAEVHVGDVLDLIILKTNDNEGTVQLSKKKFDAGQAWVTITQAEEEGTVLTGKVIDVIKGGVLVFTSGVRIFVPASLTGLPRNEALEGLKGQEVQFRIIEVNKQKRRAVGSIRAVTQEARKTAEKNFWDTAEVGQVLQGKVKSLVSYGAFVDIGGLDGMVHISELSWQRVKDPSEVLHVGDEVEVYIKSLDPEKKKISLGYRKAEENPWEVLRTQYAVGTEADATIVSFTSFGAFARVLPGIDGLIHISQIANRRIEKPQDELQIGQAVRVKIVGVDFDKRRVSLSIRALLEDETEEAAYPEDEENAIVASSNTED
jgi:4-hydroxy-3-methylbut-2-enyl diphosphate reductase